MNTLSVSSSTSVKSGCLSGNSIKRSRTSTLQLSTTTRMPRTTRLFFQTVQNKLHYAVHRHTAAELIVERADAAKEHMGLATWENAPDGKIVKADVTVAKNYLSEKEMSYLERIVSLYLDYAELQAERKIPITDCP